VSHMRERWQPHARCREAFTISGRGEGAHWRYFAFTTMGRGAAIRAPASMTAQAGHREAGGLAGRPHDSASAIGRTQLLAQDGPLWTAVGIPATRQLQPWRDSIAANRQESS
jgi:hypothetical protein